MRSEPQLTFTALAAIPKVRSGDDLAKFIIDSCKKQGIKIEDNDIFVITQKVVSKCEGRYRSLAAVMPGVKARVIAKLSRKDARFVQLVLNESKSILRVRKNTIIVEHKSGFICANAGIDHSNVDGNSKPDSDQYLLLPDDPDHSAAEIRKKLENECQRKIGVLIIDSHGRAWRNGTIGMAIGISGLPGLVDLRGKEDLYGFKLKITTVGAADELAAGASLLMGQSKEGIPVVIARGFPYPLREGTIKELIRDKNEDFFR